MTPSKPSRTKLLGFFLLWFGVASWSIANETNWPHWRGPHDDGSTEGGAYPVKWQADKVLWRAPLPGKGCSTPIVWDQRIYLTAPTNHIDAVLAFDWSGKQLWQQTFGPENPGKHRNGSGSNPSPVTDGHFLFVYFKSGTFAALDFEGHVRWQTNLVAGFGPDTFYWDHGTSPVLSERYVIMTRMHHGESWVAGFDKGTGELRWKVPRNYETPIEGDHSYSTPLLLQAQGKEALLVWGAEHLTLHNPTDGKQLWAFTSDFNPDAKPNWPTVASVVVAGDIALAASARSDRGQPRLHGIDSPLAPLRRPGLNFFGNALTLARSCPRPLFIKAESIFCVIGERSNALIRRQGKAFGKMPFRRIAQISMRHH